MWSQDLYCVWRNLLCRRVEIVFMGLSWSLNDFCTEQTAVSRVPGRELKSKSTAFGLVSQSRSLEENVLKYTILTNWYTEKWQILIGSIPCSWLGNGAVWQGFPGQQMAVQLCAEERREPVTDRSQPLTDGHCWSWSSRACPWANDYLTTLYVIIYKYKYFIVFYSEEVPPQ